MSAINTDVIVIGAGPVGLFTVFQCGMLKLKCHVIEALPELGGQCAALYPEKPIYDIPGYPSILAADLIERLMEQAAPFAPVYHQGETVLSLTKSGEVWQAKTSSGAVIEAPAVIIAAGGGAFGPNRPPLEGIESYEGKSVFYMVRKREDLRGKRIVIAGGGDSAVDWAVSLAELAANVMIVHRRAKFRAAPESEDKLKSLAEAGRIELVTPYQLHGLEGDGEKLSAVIVADLDGVERRLEADILLPFFGLANEIGPIADWGLDLDNGRILTDPASGAASKPGIFACGDIALYPGKLKLILIGFAEAARAAHSAFAICHPGEALHFEHSTSSGVPRG
jgi:thioredoxin reductase (NADPH)